MKTISHCPLCKDPLTNEEIAERNRIPPAFWIKKCEKRLTHKFAFTEDEDYNILVIRLELKVGQKIYWDIQHENLSIDKDITTDLKYPQIHITDMPYFSPDLTNFKKTIKKLQTYLVFI